MRNEKTSDQLIEENMDLAKSLAWGVIKRIPEGKRDYVKDDVLSAAYIGLTIAAGKYNSEIGTKFTTYAYPWIVGEIKAELEFFGKDMVPFDEVLENSLESYLGNAEEIVVANEIVSEVLKSASSIKINQKSKRKKKSERPNQDAQYISEQRTLEVLKVLKEISDEDHPVKQEDVFSEISTTSNRKTLSDTIEQILLGINPIEHTIENDKDYRIKYEGYDKPVDENPLSIKNRINEIRKALRRKGADKEKLEKQLKELKGGKAPTITGLRYIHDFSNHDLDNLISAVAMSSAIAPDEKEELIGKIVGTGSNYYKSPFYDKVRGRLKFDPYGIYSRTYGKKGDAEKRLAKNIRVLQDAIGKYTKVRFRFGAYDSECTYQTFSDEDILGKEHVISPYYIVVYQDNYYVIGSWNFGESACHYRIDLMSDIEIVRDKEGAPVKMRPMREIKNLPGRDKWNPGKYMNERMNMTFDSDDLKPRRISIKISSEWRYRYNHLRDWFGDYRINKTKTADCEDGYEVVEVTTSTGMLVHWAMQYSLVCEVLDEDVRKSVRESLKWMEEKYGE